MSDTYRNSGFRDDARQVQGSARRAYDDASDAMPSFGEAARAATDALRSAGNAASSVMSDLSDTGLKARDQVVSQVQEQPVAAVLIAAAVGLIAGLLLFRR